MAAPAGEDDKGDSGRDVPLPEDVGDSYSDSAGRRQLVIDGRHTPTMPHATPPMSHLLMSPLSRPQTPGGSPTHMIYDHGDSHLDSPHMSESMYSEGEGLGGSGNFGPRSPHLTVAETDDLESQYGGEEHYGEGAGPADYRTHG